MNPDIAAQLNRGATVITTTKRLARKVRLQYNRYQKDRQECAWASADILAFEAWMHRVWQKIVQRRLACPDSVHAGRIPLVLNNLQCKSVWQQIIRDDIKVHRPRDEPLWNIPATVNSAIDAWKISREWRMDLRECEYSSMSDHRSFSRWAKQYQSQCTHNRWMDSFQLMDMVAQHLESGIECSFPDLLFLGFDIFTAQQQRLISAIEHTGVDVRVHQLNHGDSEPEARHQSSQFDSQYEQWLGAAHWVKQKLAADPDLRIALVVPDLDKSRDIIDYALTQTLCPGKLLGINRSTPKPFHISPGRKPGDFALVQTALLLLSLASAKPVASTAISKTLLSPFIGAAAGECHNRSRLEYWCRQNLPFKITLAGLVKTLVRSGSAPASPKLLETLTAAMNHLPSMQNRRSYTQWSQAFLRWLDLFGWPGEAVLGSAEYQTATAFKREVAVLGTLDLVSGQETCSGALAALARHLAEQPFEPESPPVNIEVLGVLESAGMEFDAIWLGNLNENQWPPALKTNPFLPYQLQTQSNNPHTSMERNNQLARTQQSRLLHQCDEIVFSRFRFENDVPVNPGPLFSDANPTPCPGQGGTLIAYFQSVLPEFEIFVDGQGLSNPRQQIRGGVAVIQDQAACPFRAYARHRLGGAAAASRQPGLDAAERGSLIHKILEQVWREIQSSKKLHDLPKPDRVKIIEKNIDRQSRHYFYSSGCSNEFFNAQKQWLTRLFLQWLELESAREQEFAVAHLEKKQQLVLDQLILSVKIDRIDRLADGTLLLTDYKTGQVGTVYGWVDQRPKSPQLILYALAGLADQTGPDIPISALAFARVRNGECAYVGLSRDEHFQTEKHPGIKMLPLEKIKIDENLKNWQALFEYWRTNMIRLASQFQSGYAVVDPQPDACRYCDLHGLCRILQRDDN